LGTSFVQSNLTASDQQYPLPLALPLDEQVTGNQSQEEPNSVSPLMAQILERNNLIRAIKQVIRNKGAAGIDGMTVEQLPDYLKTHWPRLRQQL
jgi:hypothetical protein